MLIKGLLIQFDVISALILRETKTRFGTNFLGYFWAMIEPLLWIATFWAIFYFFDKTPSEGSITSFIITGLIPFLIFRQIINSCTNAIEANKALLFYPQVKPLDLLIARSLLEFGTAVTVFILLLLAENLYHPIVIESYLKLTISLYLVAFLSFSLGVFAASIEIVFDSIKRIIPPILRIMFFISGIFYSIQDLPEKFIDLQMYNPLYHCIEMLRDAYFTSYMHADYSYYYVTYFSLITLAVALLILQYTQKKLELI